MLEYEAHERVIIATLSASPALLSEVALALRPHHFASPALGEVYANMLHHGALDATTALRFLSPDALRSLGGAAGVCELFQLAPVSDVMPYVREVIQAFHRRVAHAALRRAADQLAEGADIGSAIAELLASISRSDSSQEFCGEDAGELFKQYVDQMFQSRASGFGVKPIDYAIGGLRAGRLHIVAGQSGSGKTTLMVQAALQAARAGRQAVIVSAEMTPAQIMAIAISHLSGVSIAPMDLLEYRRAGKYPEPLHVAVQRMREIGKAFVVIEKPAPSLADLHLYAQRYLRGTQGLLVCDYLQIMSPPAGAQNREQEVSRNAAGLKELAVRADIAVLTGSQLNREGMTRESEAPLHHTDVLLRIEQPQDEESSEPRVKMRIVKNRGGAVGAHEVVFAKKRAAFFSVEREMV
ncbi:MAG: DnaB-like helicase C-terminal domain-containing protein [Anaerolineae bacterium]|nr:DnaB-like helicase C-terminal domain-containing protein [Anaerolineae bacterium]